ncbi:MAG TPA: PEP-CTERM sorting domain-containing protein [Duganella sp.]
MKILPFLTPLLFALSLSGTAHAEAAVAAQAPSAAATIEAGDEAGNCPQHAGTECLITGESAARDDGNVDLAALPKTGPNQPVLDEAAMPVPEPATSVMMALGLALLGFTARRRAPTVTFDN